MKALPPPPSQLELWKRNPTGVNSSLHTLSAGFCTRWAVDPSRCVVGSGINDCNARQNCPGPTCENRPASLFRIAIAIPKHRTLWAWHFASPPCRAVTVASSSAVGLDEAAAEGRPQLLLSRSESGVKTAERRAKRGKP